MICSLPFVHHSTSNVDGVIREHRLKGFLVMVFQACHPDCSLACRAFSTLSFDPANSWTADNKRAKPSTAIPVRRICPPVLFAARIVPVRKTVSTVRGRGVAQFDISGMKKQTLEAQNRGNNARLHRNAGLRIWTELCQRACLRTGFPDTACYSSGWNGGLLDLLCEPQFNSRWLFSETVPALNFNAARIGNQCNLVKCGHPVEQTKPVV